MAQYGFTGKTVHMSYLLVNQSTPMLLIHLRYKCITTLFLFCFLLPWQHVSFCVFIVCFSYVLLQCL